MQRKLVSFDVFETIEKNSSLVAFNVLSEATEILSKVLESDLSNVRCYDSNSVVYECNDGTFVKATYKIENGNINFANFEEIVVDEASETNSRKDIIGNMVDALTENENDKADLLWDDLKLMLERAMRRGHKKSMVAMYDDNFKKAGKNVNEAAGMVFVRRGSKNMNRALAAKRGWGRRRHKEPAIRAKMHGKLDFYRSNRRRHAEIGKKAKNVKQGGTFARAYYTRGGKKVNEWNTAIDNFYDYLGRGLTNEAVVNKDNNGDVVSVTIPTKKLRNEGKVIQIKLDTLKADVKILRENAIKAVNGSEFSKAVAQLKRHNNVSDNESLEECLVAITGRFPQVIGLTQVELSEAISNALNFAGETNYDDETCMFMAEGILRTAFEAFPEKVDTVLRLSETDKTELDDSYLDFQTRVSDFYKKIDESISNEIKLTADVYNAISEIAGISESLQDSDTKGEATLLLSTLEPALDGSLNVDMDKTSDAVAWLEYFIESNLNPGELSYVTEPETTVSGDGAGPMHNSKMGYSPFSDVNPFSRSPQIGADSMDLKNTDGEKHGWGNVDGGNTWDRMTNPYLPASLHGRVSDRNKGEMESDSNDALGQEYAGNNTWQDSEGGLKNPYLPGSLKPMFVGDGVKKDIKM